MSDGSFNPVQQPDVGQTMNTVLGLQQKKQALQTGQYTQQTAQAGADQATRHQAQQARMSAVIANSPGKSADDLEDTLNAVGGDDAPEMIQRLRQNEATKTAVLSAKNKVNSEVRTQVANGIRGITDDDDANSVMKRFDTMEAMNPQSKGILDPLRERVQHLPPPGTPGRREGIASVAQMIDGNSGETAGMADNGPALQPLKTNALGDTVKAGQPIIKGLAPTQTPGYVRANAAAGQEGGKGAANDEDLYQDIVSKGTKAAQVKGLSQDISKLADETKTGTYSKALADKWSSVSQMFGVSPSDTSSTTRRMLLGKYAAQLAMQQEQANGASTDAAQANVHAAMPDPEHMDPEAIKSAAKFVGGQADLSASRAQVANAQRQRNGGISTGLRAVDSQFMQNAEPRQFVYKSLPAGPERQAYLKEHFSDPKTGKVDPSQVQDFLDKKAITEHFVGGQ